MKKYYHTVTDFMLRANIAKKVYGPFSTKVEAENSIRKILSLIPHQYMFTSDDDFEKLFSRTIKAKKVSILN